MTETKTNVGDGEKPRIWWSSWAQVWWCGIGRSTDGCGDSPSEAYRDWCLGMLTYEAQKQGLYAAPEEAQ